MAQHWNDILDYVKVELGVPVNLLEITDDDLIKQLKDHVLTLFSQYSPHDQWTYLDKNNVITGLVAGSPMYAYRIPVDPGTYIVDILEAYPTKEISIIDMYGGAIINAQAAMDLVISNSYIDAVRSLTTRQTWEFVPPDVLIFDKELGACVVKYQIPHKVLTTVRPDLYHKALKPMCLGRTKMWIASMRSKFENLATPVGQLNLSFEKLQSEGKETWDTAVNILETLPPKILIDVSI